MKLNINPGNIARAAIKEFAPDMLDGMVEEWVKGKDTRQIHDFILNLDLWSQIPPKRQEFLLGYKPWDLNWLTPDWVLHTIAKYNKSGAFLIMTSPALQGKLKLALEKLKKELE